MKRSELNKIMKEALIFIEQMNFKLPPFVYWKAEEWEDKSQEYNEIRDNMLGWDITDFGSGNFHKEGLLMITIRNGNFTLNEYIKPYAEKILIVEEGQVTPYHYHWNKMEDIINRGGGNLQLQLFNSTEDNGFAETPVAISLDGKNTTEPAGTVITLKPGESITIPPKMYHKFWGAEGTGKVLVGEVSNVNDDRVDNNFYDEVGRFPGITEDEEPLYLLYNEYPSTK